MNTKNNYVKSLDTLKDICIRYKLDEDLLKDIDCTKAQVEEFKVKIPLVGGFNAGKSALINTYLGLKILPEEQSPETAIAAEIKYGTERIIAHRIDGNTKTFNLDDIQNISSKEYKYIEVFVESDSLKALGEDVVLVDMPGFDSGIEAHNRAIFQYLKEGVVFLIVADCEDGGLKSTVLDFIYELDLYQLNFGVLVNKGDKIPKEDMDEIVSHIGATTESMSSEHIPVERTSIHWKETPGIIKNMINSFEKEEVFKKVFRQRVLKIVDRVEKSLNILLNNSEVDTKEIKEKIDSIEKKMKDLREKLAREEKVITNKLKNNVKTNILTDLKTVLYNNSSVLANAAMAGEAAFNLRVNELIRPVLMASTNHQLEITFTQLLDNISADVVDLDKIAGGIKEKLSATEVGMERIKDGLDKMKDISKNMEKFEKLYKLVSGGLAIITNVVAPWLELILVFLPDILKLLGFGSEDDKREKIKSQIECDIIPAMVSKLEPQILGSLQDIKSEFMENIRSEIEENQKILEKNLKQAIKDKELKEEEFNTYISKIKDDIKAIEILAESI